MCIIAWAFVSACSCGKMVYICNGPYSKRYHESPNCKGLYKCTTDIDEVSIREAKNMGRTPCQECNP